MDNFIDDFSNWFNNLDRDNKTRVKIGLRWLMRIEKENLPMNLSFNGDGRKNITCSSTKISGKVLEELL